MKADTTTAENRQCSRSQVPKELGGECSPRRSFHCDDTLVIEWGRGEMMARDALALSFFCSLDKTDLRRAGFPIHIYRLLELAIHVIEKPVSASSKR